MPAAARRFCASPPFETEEVEEVEVEAETDLALPASAIAFFFVSCGSAPSPNSWSPRAVKNLGFSV